MKYFTIGPVEMSSKTLEAGGMQPEYFRDSDFAEKIISLQSDLIDLVCANTDSKVAILSSSGTAAMEAAVINFSRRGDKALVINGGSFGDRFKEILDFYNRDVEEHKVQSGKDIDINYLEKQIIASKPTVLFVNAHETSTGQLYNLKAIGLLCKKHDILFVCDAISTIACDPYYMAEWNINVTLFSANKGLAVSPGVGFVVMDQKALDKLHCDESYYLNLSKYLSSYERGQPPFTSAVSVLMQLIARIDEMKSIGGIEQVIRNIQDNALIFRTLLNDHGVDIFPQTSSNAITAFKLNKGNSEELYQELKKKNLLINKSAWGLEYDIPRVSHVGNLTREDHINLANEIIEYIKNVH